MCGLRKASEGPSQEATREMLRQQEPRGFPMQSGEVLKSRGGGGPGHWQRPACDVAQKAGWGQMAAASDARLSRLGTQRVLPGRLADQGRD